MKRYLSRERALSPEEQAAIHQRRVEDAEDEVRMAQAHLDEVMAMPLPATTTDYIEVKEGEPGYEDAPFVNSMIMYSGEVVQQNIADRPSPWSAMVGRGVYPEGLSTT